MPRIVTFMSKLTRTLPWLLVIASALPPAANAQTREGLQRARAERYLNDLHADLKRSYYDPSFRGVDIEAEYDSAKARLKRANTNQERYYAIERFLQSLDDSHTAFIGLNRVGLRDFNLDVQFFGPSAFVTGVDSASNAATVGLRAGDEILEFDGKELARESARSVLASFLTQDPIPALRLKVRAPDRSIAELVIQPDTAAIYRVKGKQLRRMLSLWRDSIELSTSHIQATIADSVFYWRLPQFTHADKGIGDVMKRARKHAVLVLDLRGNGGGSIATLTRLTSYFVTEPLTVGDLHTRTGREQFIAKPDKDPFTGRMLILVDSETASASEIFARLMQLNQRATVYGDQTMGAVMASQYFSYDYGVGASITVSDFVLHNGERLEKAGVRPDVFVVPPPQYIGKGVDVVLSFVLGKAGARVSPAAAARLSLTR